MPLQHLMVSLLCLKIIDYSLYVIIQFYQQIHFVNFVYDLELKIVYGLVLSENQPCAIRTRPTTTTVKIVTTLQMTKTIFNRLATETLRELILTSITWKGEKYRYQSEEE